ncbi:MAG: rhodanese-like domain-containing protein [Candidatus Bathyarchaeota archaeon]|nr:rhodanese-like domain-containing protein [Candidatus Bathyarchaeota archaeon]
MKNKVVLTIFVLVVFSFCSPCINASSGWVDVTVSEAKDMIDSNPLLVVLDVRTQSEYDSGHIRNAELIPHTELEARISELDENRETLVYCGSGGRSVTASQILVDYGFSKVYNMIDGIMAWIGAGYPVFVRYSSIQQAISNASDGDTIFVSSGVYYEHLTVNKSLALVGENRNSTIVDGGSEGTVIHVNSTSNVSVMDFTLQNSGCGCKGYGGVHVQDSHDVNVTDNLIRDNGFGIKLDYSSYKTIIARNNITNNTEGITVRTSSDNMFYHNNLVNNIYQAFAFRAESNAWDDGYPSGGNYWSDYLGVDEKMGQYQNVDGSDGIGDIQYLIDEYNQDNYPLMNPYTPETQNIQEAYRRLIGYYNALQSDFNTLNSTYHELFHSYDNLLTDYNDLQLNFDALNINYDLLNLSYNELKTEQETTITELNNIRNLMYTFITTTIILIATTAYFTKKSSAHV